MPNRTAKFLSTVVAGCLAGAALTGVSHGATPAPAADECLSGPNKDQTPSGSHWYYRIDRATKRHCWYLGPQRDARAQVAPSNTASIAPSKVSPSTAPAAPKAQAAVPGTSRQRPRRTNRVTNARRTGGERCGSGAFSRTDRHDGRRQQRPCERGECGCARISDLGALARPIGRKFARRPGAGDGQFESQPRTNISRPATSRRPARQCGRTIRKTVRINPDAVDRDRRRAGACRSRGQRNRPVRRPAADRRRRDRGRSLRDVGRSARRSPIATGCPKPGGAEARPAHGIPANCVQPVRLARLMLLLPAQPVLLGQPMPPGPPVLLDQRMLPALPVLPMTRLRKCWRGWRETHTVEGRRYFSSCRCNPRTNVVRPVRRSRLSRSALRIDCTSANASSIS